MNVPTLLEIEVRKVKEIIKQKSMENYDRTTYVITSKNEDFDSELLDCNFGRG